MKTGKLANGNGLCNERLPLLELFEPTEENDAEYDLNAYWASGYNHIDWGNPEFVAGFTPLRQTIVLLMASYSREL